MTVTFPDAPTGHTFHRDTFSLSSPGCPRTHHLTTASVATLLPKEGLRVSKDSKSATACQAGLRVSLRPRAPTWHPCLGSGTQVS